MLYCNNVFIALELNSSVDALKEVNVTVGRLLSLTQSLQMQLDNLTNQVDQLQRDCTGVPAAVCNNIPTLSYTVNVNYGVVSVHAYICYYYYYYYYCVCVHVCACVRACVCVYAFPFPLGKPLIVSYFESLTKF